MSPDLTANEVRRKGNEPDFESVEFTQFLSDGPRKTVSIPLSRDLAKKAKILKEKGFKFKIENHDGLIWMTIIHGTIKDQDITRIVPNGPLVPNNVAAHIEDAYEKWGKP